MHDIDPDVAIVGNDPDKYICASEVNSTGYMTGWDYCDTCCPGASVESTPQMEADPKNEERNYCCKYNFLAILCLKTYFSLRCS